MAGTQERVAVVGLGYVGLPVALAFARAAGGAVGFDVSARRIAELRAGHDATGEIDPETLAGSALTLSDDPEALAGASLVIVTVPTPIDAAKRPDFGPLRAACAAIGPRLAKGAAVVFESTVYPGATEEICGPALEAASGMTAGRDFHLGYSPERINPGDAAHRLESIVKVVAGDTPETRARVAAAYRAIVPAGVFEAASIATAEAAKVIENTQRDINIALMNELSLIFERLGLDTAEVLAAARTKWNFLPFTPGLVGGHCIGVDPYYLTARAEAVGHHPEVILAGRRINDAMGRVVARKTVKLMVAAGIGLTGARVGLLGLTFKENVPDLRNSRCPDILDELASFGIAAAAADAAAPAAMLREEAGIEPAPESAFAGLDALILAVPHAAYLAEPERIVAMVRPGGVLVDVKRALPAAALRPDLTVWGL
ncbi:nucleotide sugar dehydrogenase [Paralimibaculum aggregatum]|uniref:Nucleotide sugar dehydrogenase n=1 Tax=Paralimibaculum aggregatum TaxID=3036245 RepID=A0ABQ6LFC2_9RHOB|nr:nucleotide sugar dehydrogenase [Limibaculum sp. NKW23]GMG81086.1 nucleotide sugar dehydrogenase [Limibaculum sp. NKW23]